MNIARIDLNLLVYLDMLLRERNVTRAANQLGITQPAMSNGLRRLRDLFEDPLLVRTSEGMIPTERAQKLQPQIRNILANVEKTVQTTTEFHAEDSERVFRIMRVITPSPLLFNRYWKSSVKLPPRYAWTS